MDYEDTAPVQLAPEPGKARAMSLAVQAIVAVKREFGKDLTPDMIPELHAALALELLPTPVPYEAELGLQDENGKRYLVKACTANARRVDVYTWDFDYLVLVNLADDYTLQGMWRLPIQRAAPLFTRRADHPRSRALQSKLKANAEFVTGTALDATSR
jgi:hypothetical protein